jgi:DNA-binding transcriptional regulator YdaS (Cro superfamily)
MRDPIVDRVAEIVAGQKKGALTILARKLGITQAAVSQWKKIPLARAIQIEALTKGKITRQEMRPDFWRDE